MPLPLPSPLERGTLLWMCQEPQGCDTIKRDKRGQGSGHTPTKVPLHSSLLRMCHSGSSSRVPSERFYYGDWNEKLYSEVLVGSKEPSRRSEVSKDQRQQEPIATPRPKVGEGT